MQGIACEEASQLEVGRPRIGPDASEDTTDPRRERRDACSPRKVRGLSGGRAGCCSRCAATAHSALETVQSCHGGRGRPRSPL
eukprot:scaffold2326_cov286-Pinguiococcus_pyrenoidosus.AAC.1